MAVKFSFHHHKLISLIFSLDYIFRIYYFIYSKGHFCKAVRLLVKDSSNLQGMISEAPESSLIPSEKLKMTGVLRKGSHCKSQKIKERKSVFS